MALNSANVTVAVSGVVSVGATTATAPTDASTALGSGASGFTDLGYINEDGVTETRDRSTNDIKAWQGGATVRTVVTDATLTYSFVMIETTQAGVETYYGAPLDSVTGSIVITPSSTGGRRSFVIDVVDGTNLIRTYIPSGEVTEVGDMQYVNGDPVGYEVTVTAYPSAAINGGSAKKWFSALKA